MGRHRSALPPRATQIMMRSTTSCSRQGSRGVVLPRQYPRCLLAVACMATCFTRTHAFSPAQPWRSMHVRPITTLQPARSQLSLLSGGARLGVVAVTRHTSLAAATAGLQRNDVSRPSRQTCRCSGELSTRHCTTPACERAHRADLGSKSDDPSPTLPTTKTAKPSADTRLPRRVDHKIGHKKEFEGKGSEQGQDDGQDQRRGSSQSQPESNKQRTSGSGEDIGRHAHSRKGQQRRKDVVRPPCTGRYCRKHWALAQGQEPAPLSAAHVLGKDGPLDVEAYARAIEADIARIARARE